MKIIVIPIKTALIRSIVYFSKYFLHFFCETSIISIPKRKTSRLIKKKLSKVKLIHYSSLVFSKLEMAVRVGFEPTKERA